MASPSLLLHISNLSPVAALAFVATPDPPGPPSQVSNPSLLVGEGPFVKVLDVSTAASRSKRRIFSRERVHGISLYPSYPSPPPQNILFWGGRSICITTVASLLEEDSVFNEVRVPDWVFNAVLIPYSPPSSTLKVVVITAHNSLLLYDSPSSSWQELATGDRCMLYSAHLLYLPADGDPQPHHRFLVAAGTVFGEILIWSIKAGSPERLGDSGSAETHYRLLGHEGSIFGVNISPKYQNNKRYLTSCSDDRTIRVWDISQWDSSAGALENAKLKRTGFGHQVEQGGECISIGWGHGARIWGVRFLPELKGGRVWLLSVSEDLTSKFWSFDSENINSMTHKLELRNMATYLLHSGKHIWSFALDFEKGLLATGGADGRIGLVRYHDDLESIEEQWDIETVLGQALGRIPEDQTQDRPEEKAGKGQDAFKEYAALDENRFVATTTQGRVLIYTLSQNSWRILGQWGELRGWSILKAWGGTGFIALGNRSGKIGVVDVASRREWWWEAVEGYQGKAAGVFLGKSGTGGIDSCNYFILTTALSPAVFSLHSFSMNTSNSPPVLIDRKTILLSSPTGPGEPKFLVTSLSITSNLLFLGSRTGGLGIYDTTSKAVPLNAMSYYPSIHSSDAITSITPLPSTSTADILTTSRNGEYSLLAIPSISSPPSPHHCSKPAFVIEGAAYTPTSHLYLWGFRGKYFTLYSETHNHEVSTAECGGAHRAWAFHLNSWFVWTKAGKAHIAPLPPCQETLQQGLHGREIKSLAIHGTTLATGAEDTLIHLSTISAATANALHPRGRAKKHTTGVHSLLFSPCGRHLFSAGGAGEFFAWRVNSPEAIVWEAGCQARTDLRIEGFDVTATKTKGVFLVALGYSDSSIRVYEYDVDGKDFELKMAAAYKQCCILHVKTLANTLVVAGTDGYITGYDLQLPFPPTEKVGGEAVAGLGKVRFEKRVHQNSVKALQVQEKDDGVIWIYSGGDDTAIAITRIGKGGAAEAWVVPRAHASAVTALVHVGGNKVLTAGADQRVKLWEVERDEDGERVVAVKVVAEGESAVADISGAVMAGDNKVVIAGVGVDVWQVESGQA